MIGSCFCLEEFTDHYEADELGDLGTLTTLDSSSMATSVDTECATNDDILECDYDTNQTPLYRAIEEKNWSEVLHFIDTGEWNGFLMSYQNGDSPSEQARTWVTKVDDSGDVNWSQLPLHTAVSLLAPFEVISKLVDLYPKAVRCADDKDMLPLHIAFRFGASDEIVALLLSAFPEAIGVKAVKGRTPLDMARFSPNHERAEVIEAFMENAKQEARKDWELEYTVTLLHANEKGAIDKTLDEKRDRLKEIISELLRSREEIKDLKNQMAQEKRDRVISEARMKQTEGNDKESDNVSRVSTGSKLLSIFKKSKLSKGFRRKKQASDDDKDGLTMLEELETLPE